MTAAAHVLAVSNALNGVMRQDRGRLLSALIARLRDFQLAEEVLQEAATSALVHWGRNGVPDNPKAWLLRVAWRKALDRLRKSSRESRNLGQMTLLAEEEAADMTVEDIPDERLRLIFTCCHPALEVKSQLALTLRTLGGLTTVEIARAFLDNETTMGQRLSRAKAKIAAAGIPFAVPGREDWAQRMQAVLAVIYLIFNEGYSATRADTPLRAALCHEAIYLARMVTHLQPDDAEAQGLLALMLITDARSIARLDATGQMVPLTQQDRALWNAAQIAEGVRVLDAALIHRTPGPYQIKAAIAALHVQPGPTDWPQIVALYDSLLRMEPTGVVQVNRAVALAEAGVPDAAFAILQQLASPLAGYQPFHAAMAEILCRLSRFTAACAAYDRAIALAGSASDAAFLSRRRDAALKNAADENS